MVLDGRSGLDMSVRVGELESTASYYVVGEKVAKT